MRVIKLFEKTEFIRVLQNEKLQNVRGKAISFIKYFLAYSEIIHEDLLKHSFFFKNLEENSKFVLTGKQKFNFLIVREIEVFILVTDGKTTKEIFENFFIETFTVFKHGKY